MIKKQLITSAVVASVGTLGIIGLASATTVAKPGSLAGEIAQRFHLKQADVQAVIDRHHGEMHAYHEQQYEERLNQAVTDGNLTAAQKDHILAKHQELVSFMASLKDKTPAERRTAMEQKRTEIRSWEQANGIPAGYLGGPGGGFGGRGFGHGPGGGQGAGPDGGAGGGQGAGPEGPSEMPAR